MDIKVGDIVTIRGKAQRVTSIGRYGIVLSSFGLFSRDRFENYMNMFKGVIDIEHITLPQLNVGDWVVVRAISASTVFALIPVDNTVYGSTYDVFHTRTDKTYVFSDDVNAEDREIDFVEAEQEVGFDEPVIYVYTK